jgi:hypothetical protein
LLKTQQKSKIVESDDSLISIRSLFANRSGERVLLIPVYFFETLKLGNVLVLNLFSSDSRLSSCNFSELISFCPQLQSIQLEKCIQVDSTFVIDLTKISPQITDVNLKECILIDDLAVTILTCTYNSQLTGLNLHGCLKVTAKSMHFIGENCRCLTSLNVSLSECVQEMDIFHDYLEDIYEEGFQIIATNCVQLKTLIAEFRPRLSIKCFDLLVLNCPKLSILNAKISPPFSHRKCANTLTNSSILFPLQTKNAFKFTELLLPSWGLRGSDRMQFLH